MKNIEIHVGLPCVVQGGQGLLVTGKVISAITSRSAGPRKYLIQLDDGRTTVQCTARQIWRSEPAPVVASPHPNRREP